MSYKVTILLQLCYLVARVVSNSNSVVPCERDDVTCMTKSAHLVVSHIAAGIPSLNIDPIEPLRQEDVFVQISDFTANYKNNSIKGYSKCEISDLSLNLKVKTLQFNLTCPLLELEGYVEMNGQLGLPVVGNDTYKVKLEKYVINVEANIEIINGDDTTHMNIKSFKINGEARGGCHIDYKNFHIKQNVPPEAENDLKIKKLEEILILSTPSYLHKTFEAIFKIVNNFLQTIPFDALFID